MELLEGQKTGPEEDRHEMGNISRKEGIGFTGSLLFITFGRSHETWMKRIFRILFSLFEEGQVCKHPNRRNATESMVRLILAFPKVPKAVIMESEVIRKTKKTRRYSVWMPRKLRKKRKEKAVKRFLQKQTENTV